MQPPVAWLCSQQRILARTHPCPACPHRYCRPERQKGPGGLPEPRSRSPGQLAERRKSQTQSHRSVGDFADKAADGAGTDTRRQQQNGENRRKLCTHASPHQSPGNSLATPPQWRQVQPARRQVRSSKSKARPEIGRQVPAPWQGWSCRSEPRPMQDLSAGRQSSRSKRARSSRPTRVRNNQDRCVTLPNPVASPVASMIPRPSTG